MTDAAARILDEELGPLAAQIMLCGADFASSPNPPDEGDALRQLVRYYRDMVRLYSEAARKADAALRALG